MIARDRIFVNSVLLIFPCQKHNLYNFHYGRIYFPERFIEIMYDISGNILI